MLEQVIKRPVSVGISAFALVVVGLFSLWRLPVSLLPTLERPRLEVTARAADLAREEMLDQVVEPLERRFQSLPGVLDIYSIVDDGEAVLVLETEWQTDVDRLRIDAERRLADAGSGALDELSVRVAAGDRAPILQVAVTGGATAYERTAFAEKVLLPELGRLRGAGELRQVGGARLRPVVRPRAADLMARGLTAESVLRRMQDLGTSQPLGLVRQGASRRPLILRRNIEHLTELAATRVQDDGDVRLRDVADVSLEEVPDDGIFRLDGEPAVLVEVFRAPDANAVLLARAGRQVIQRLAERDGSSLRLELVRDASQEVTGSLRQLAVAGLLGLLLGTFVLRFMLGSWRPTVTLALVVPASIISAFSAFFLWDISLDVVSLAGLALAAGMLVDNSIVVLEAIASSREQGKPEPVIHGSQQIAMALVASFLTTAVVFLPLIYLRGLARAFFGVQAFAIVSSVGISLLLSLSLTPVLARRLGEDQPQRAGGQNLGRSPGRQGYLRFLDWALAHRWMVGLALLLVLAAAAARFPALPRELMPMSSARVLGVDYRLPAGIETNTAQQRLLTLETQLKSAAPKAQQILSTYRGEDGAGAAETAYGGSVELSFAHSEGVTEALNQLRQSALVAGVQTAVRVRGSAVSSAIERSGEGLELELSAATPRRAEALSERVVEGLANEGLEARRVGIRAMVAVSGRGDRRPAWVLHWDEMRLAELSVRSSELAPQVAASLGGRFAGRVDLDGSEAEILVESMQPQDPRWLPIAVADRVLPLSALARLEQRWQEAPAERRNGRPTVRLTVAGTNVEQLERHLNSLSLAIDEQVRLSGQTRELRRSFEQLRLALGLALILVFLTVAALYESLALPLVVMVTVPVAAAGAILGLDVTAQSLNVMSFLGLILLAGIVVNNAIVLVHRIEQLRSAGSPAKEAVRQAAAERYRPILMTTLTTLLGMLPLALLGGEGIELRRGLAVAVCGGLTTSWLASLIVVPVLYLAWVRTER